MPRLHHVVEVHRSTAGAVDDYNQPSQTFASIGTVQALIQPKGGDELSQVNEAGPVRGLYKVFVLPMDVTEGDHLVRLSPPEVYEIEFVANEGGVGHHLKLSCDRVWP